MGFLFFWDALYNSFCSIISSFKTTSVARGLGGGGIPPPPIMLFRRFVGTFGNRSVQKKKTNKLCHFYRQSLKEIAVF